MLTSIDIKKRITIKEEGSPITTDVNSINFTGDGATASTIGNDVTINIPGAYGVTTFYMNETVTQAPYKEFSSTPTATAEQTIVTNVAPATTVTIQSFQTPVGVPNTTNIPGGRWAFYVHFSGTLGDSWTIFAEVYLRDLGAVETLLLTTDAILTTTLSGTATMILTDGVFPTTTTLTTDRIVVKVKATNNDPVNNKTITFHTEGSTNYSIGTTTLNQVIPAGAVTSVTGVAPVQSSGGTTPAISIPQATALVDGYLSAADWTLFSYNRQIQDEGINVTQRTTIDFQGLGVSVADSGGKTVVTIPGSPFGKIGITNVNGEYTYYSTLSAAVTASIAGDTIVFFTNITETGAVTVTLPDGVDINLNGFTYTLNNAGVSNAIVTVSGATNNIFNGTISRTGGGLSLTDSLALRHDNSTLILSNVIISNVGNTAVYSTGGTIEGEWTINAGYGINADTGSLTLYNGLIQTTSAAIVTSIFTTLINTKIISSGQGIVGGPVEIYSSFIIATGAQGILLTAGDITIFDSTILSSASVAIQSGSSGKVTIVNSFVSSFAGSAVLISLANIVGVSIYNSVFTALTSTVLNITSSGNVEIFGNTVRINTASAVNGMILRGNSSNNIKVTHNYVYVSSASASTSNGITLVNSATTSFDIVKNYIEVISGAAASRCLTTGVSAFTVYYADNAFKINGTTPLGAAMIQGMVNTPDGYGNILIG